MQPSRYLLLPFVFDLRHLQEDLRKLQAANWITHFNTNAYERGWSCLPLRAVGGNMDSIIPVENGNFQDTAHLNACRYFREVIDTFACDKASIRLMSLAPGCTIREHRDPKTSTDDGITRLHIPIQTKPDVVFRIDGESVHFSAANTWYLNASCLHSVINPGTEARVHLMLDCINNAWLDNVLRQAGAIARPVHPYPDASINDDNVVAVITQLRAGGHPAGVQLAAELENIQAQQRNAQLLLMQH